MGLSLPVPCYSQVSRRAQRLGKILKRLVSPGKRTIVFDSTGLKVYGEGEWKVRIHGTGKRRTWKKLHIGLDHATQEIVMCELTDRDGGDAATAVSMLDGMDDVIVEVLGDGAYDSGELRAVVEDLNAEFTVPPPKHASYKGARNGWERKRDSTLAEIQGLGGDADARSLWKKLRGYHRRSLVETTMYRIKQIFGGGLKARCTPNQIVEVKCKCLILNMMSRLGLPQGEWIETAV